MPFPLIPPRSTRRCLLALAGAGRLARGGCAGPATSVADSAALAQQAYAQNGTLRAVSDALDQRLDALVALQTDVQTAAR